MQEYKNITPIDKDGERHGYWEAYWPDGNIYYKGTYHHGEQIGYWQYGSIKPEYYARM